MLILSVLWSVAGAGSLEVQLIDPNNGPVESLDLDDMKLEQSYEIGGYAIIRPLSYTFYDSFAQYNKDAAGNNRTDGTSPDPAKVSTQKSTGWHSYYTQMNWMDSGTSADFAYLVMDIVNLQKKDVAFMQEATVKVIYDDDYEFVGWIRQMNYDYNQAVFRNNYDEAHAPTAVLDPENEEPVAMMYTGNFVFGCTLPNEVVNSKAPLRMVITLGNNELTYHIRK